MSMMPTASSLRDWAGEFLGNIPLMVVTNREPYQHDQSADRITVTQAGGGVVSALHPVLESIDGLWIAHGSGTADRKTVDDQYNVAVPPDSPKYILHRVWLTKEQERRYYSGFCNQTLWPLCHTAWVRPKIDRKDWRAYEAVNERFAQAILSQIDGTPPLVWLHDYHLALVPRMLRTRATTRSIGFFWHIPWPSEAVFRILPWKHDLLEGLLGADVLAFHSEHYVTNFLQTVESELDATIDEKRGEVIYAHHTTRVRHFPLGVDYQWFSERAALAEHARAHLKRRIARSVQHICLSVSRIDYTKGLVECLDGVDLFLQRYPEYRKKFVYVLIGAPSRTSIPAFAQLNRTVAEHVRRINRKYRSGHWNPIYYIRENMEWEDLVHFYRAANLFLVGSLDDAMNLICKEYVACCDDENAVLLLSSLIGAAEELVDAVQFNPYDVEAIALVLHEAVTMKGVERARRIAALKRQVCEYDVYNWARHNLEAMLDTPPPA